MKNLPPDQAESPAFEIVNAAGNSPVLLVCDHASHYVPRHLHDLGLAAQQLADHIGWDPGAAEVARQLSTLLDAPLVLSGCSRLVIDCNRPLHSAESIAEHSAGITIPGNLNLSVQDREQRIAAYFTPYHQAIESLLDARHPRTKMLLSIHSFTQNLNGQERPWHIGVSFWHHQRLARRLHDQLIQHRDIQVGYNQPYPIEEEFDYTIPRHGEGRGLASAMIEIRNNEIHSPVTVEFWAARIAQAAQNVIADDYMTQ